MAESWGSYSAFFVFNIIILSMCMSMFGYLMSCTLVLSKFALLMHYFALQMISSNFPLHRNVVSVWNHHRILL